MNKYTILRLTLMSALLLIIVFIFTNLNFYNFNNINVSKDLPEPQISTDLPKINFPSGDIESAKKLNIDFELVGIRGNNPNSTIIILDAGKYKLVNQGEPIIANILFDRIDGSRAYFYNGTEYSYLDIIGSEVSFDKSKVNTD